MRGKYNDMQRDAGDGKNVEKAGPDGKDI